MCARGVEGGAVADAEADHPGDAQVHVLDPPEVRLLLRVEIFLRAGRGGGGDHVDEAGGVGVDQPHPLLGGLRGDQHDEPQAVAFGDGLVALHVILERQVRDDHPVDAHLHAALTEALEPESEHGVEVAHQDEGDVHVGADAFQLGEKFLEGHPVPQGLGGGVLDHGAVGHRVAERDPDLDHRHALPGEGADDVRRAVQGGRAGAEVDGEQSLRIAAEESVYTVHGLIVAGFPKRFPSVPGP